MRAAYPGVWLLAWKPQKMSITGTIRPRAVFAQSEACYAAPCRLVRPESHKDGAGPYKTVERRVIPRYAVLCGILWCYMDTGSNGMVQGGAIRRAFCGLEILNRMRRREPRRTPWREPSCTLMLLSPIRAESCWMSNRSLGWK